MKEGSPELATLPFFRAFFLPMNGTGSRLGAVIGFSPTDPKKSPYQAMEVTARLSESMGASVLEASAAGQGNAQLIGRSYSSKLVQCCEKNVVHASATNTIHDASEQVNQALDHWWRFGCFRRVPVLANIRPPHCAPDRQR
jgi:hypothetical protein